MATDRVIEKTFAVGKRYRCTWTITLDTGMPSSVVEWAPYKPTRLTRAEWRQYRIGRDAVMADLASALGCSVAVLEA